MTLGTAVIISALLTSWSPPPAAGARLLPAQDRPAAEQGRVLHSLRCQLNYAREGKITRRQPEQQNEQAWCLTVTTNAVICWHTEYMGLAVDELRGAGREMDSEVLAHISPARSSAVNYYGSITVDYEHELSPAR
ncbi:Tn3 family transposase [Streptomyces sp. NBC_00878]|uniref:Tn3 family transposase n=1 Tax=Streptomyces sp. NBC_00878 TaxID=2975854 RepID=UPI0022520B5C|nr:Tn3 family transposase [Streptomyces sp. NBC_00878]MCX4909590.1 transposase [Streptomyces sp. NBC_00878]